MDWSYIIGYYWAAFGETYYINTAEGQYEV